MDDEYLQRVAGAFLSWQITWTYNKEGGVACDYKAALDALNRYEIESEMIEILYRMKMEWVANG